MKYEIETIRKEERLYVVEAISPEAAEEAVLDELLTAEKVVVVDNYVHAVRLRKEEP